MRLKALTAACGVALAALAAPAAAQFTPIAETNVVMLSGATAPDEFLEAIATALFQPGFFRYQDDNGTPADFGDDGRGWRAFRGLLAAGAVPGLAAGTDILFIKRSAGGSVWGVNPVARGQFVRTLNISDATCVLNGAAYRCQRVGADPTSATDPGNPAGRIPDFGVSDVEPALFREPLNTENAVSAPANPPGGVPLKELSATERNRIPPKGVNVLAMGIVATNAVPDTVQFTRADYGAILQGVIQDWSSAVPPFAIGNPGAVVCRRVNGSGTQTSYNWFFHNFPCVGGAATAPGRMVANSASGIVAGDGLGAGTAFQIDPTAGYTVVENSGSGNVRDCMWAAQNTERYNFVGDDGYNYAIRFDWGKTSSPPADIGNAANGGQGPFGAIGVLSLDSLGAGAPSGGAPDKRPFPTNPAGSYSFRPLDGAGKYDPTDLADFCASGSCTGELPNKQNLLQGKYEFAVEVTMQYRTGTVANANCNAGAAPTCNGTTVRALTDAALATKKAFVDEFIKRAGAEAFQKDWTAALPTDGKVPAINAAGVVTNQVARGTRFGNMCSPLQKQL